MVLSAERKETVLLRALLFDQINRFSYPLLTLNILFELLK